MHEFPTILSPKPITFSINKIKRFESNKIKLETFLCKVDLYEILCNAYYTYIFEKIALLYSFKLNE